MLEREPFFKREAQGEQKGIEGENLVRDFFEAAYPFVTRVEKVSDFDDRNVGVDFVIAIDGEHKLAVEVSSPDKKRRTEKTKKEILIPLIVLHDESGKPTSAPIPRVRIGYNVGFWLGRGHEAQEKNVGVMDVLSDKETQKLKREFEGQILAQFDYHSKSSDYSRIVAPIRGAIEKELGQVAA